MPEVDLDGPEPLYQQVAAVLESRIADGTYPPGRKIPSARAIMEEFGVGQQTAEGAVRLLRDKGLVRGVVGKGTFVERQQEETPGT